MPELSFLYIWIDRQPAVMTHVRIKKTFKCTHFILFCIIEKASKTWTIWIYGKRGNGVC